MLCKVKAQPLFSHYFVVWDQHEQFLKLVRNNRIVVLVGETGALLLLCSFDCESKKVIFQCRIHWSEDLDSVFNIWQLDPTHRASLYVYAYVR